MTVYMQVYIDYGDGLAKSEDLELMGICVFYLIDKEYQIIKLGLTVTFLFFIFLFFIFLVFFEKVFTGRGN